MPYARIKAVVLDHGNHPLPAATILNTTLSYARAYHPSLERKLLMVYRHPALRRRSIRLVSILLGIVTLFLSIRPSTAVLPSGGTTIFLPVLLNLNARPFDVQTDGFQFANYGGPSYTNLTSVEMRRLFGDAACANLNLDGSCLLTPPAERWMNWVNDSMQFGHCEGMAILSLLFQRGLLNPADFGAPRTQDLVLEGNTKLQREIAYWYATMLTDAGRQTRIIAPPSELVTQLRTAFDQSQPPLATLRFTKLDRSGGHAVVPISLRTISAYEVAVTVYDSNFPLITRDLFIDTAANTWRYSPALDPQETADDYNGTATSLTLGLAPIAPRQGQQPCSFCAVPSMSHTDNGRSAMQEGRTMGDIVTSPYPGFTPGVNNGDVNPQGGSPVDESLFPSLLARTPQQSPAPLPWTNPVLHYFRHQPATETRFLMTTTSPTQTNVPVGMLSIGRGYTFVVETLVDAGLPSELAFGASGDVITYTTQTTRSPSMTLGFETVTDDFDFYIQDFELEAHDSVILDINTDSRLVRIQTQTATPGGSIAFSLAMERIDNEGIEIFDSADDGLVLHENEPLLIDYSTWSGNGGMLRLGYDTNGNGQIDPDEAFLIGDTGDTVP